MTTIVIRISKGGQISVPADVRRRWQASEVAVEDLGDHLVLRPVPADPIAAALGSMKSPDGSTGDELARRQRDEEAGIESAREAR